MSTKLFQNNLKQFVHNAGKEFYFNVLNITFVSCNVCSPLGTFQSSHSNNNDEFQKDNNYSHKLKTIELGLSDSPNPIVLLNKY